MKQTKLDRLQRGRLHRIKLEVRDSWQARSGPTSIFESVAADGHHGC